MLIYQKHTVNATYGVHEVNVTCDPTFSHFPHYLNGMYQTM